MNVDKNRVFVGYRVKDKNSHRYVQLTDIAWASCLLSFSTPSNNVMTRTTARGVLRTWREAGYDGYIVRIYRKKW